MRIAATGSVKAYEWCNFNRFEEIYFIKFNLNVSMPQEGLSCLNLAAHRLPLEASHAKTIVLYQGLSKC